MKTRGGNMRTAPNSAASSMSRPADSQLEAVRRGGSDHRRPDFLVKWHVSVESRPQSTPMATPTFRDVGPMPSAGSTSVPVMVTRQYREGTLILDIVDPGSDTVVWRGSAQAQLAGSGEPPD